MNLSYITLFIISRLRVHEGASKGGLWRRDSLLSDFSTLNSESDFSTLNSEDSCAPWGLFQVKCPIQGLIPWPFPEIKLFKEFVRRSSCKRFTQLTKRTMTFATVMEQLPLPSPLFTLILLLFLTALIFLRCSGLEKYFCKILSESHVHCTAISYEL